MTAPITRATLPRELMGNTVEAMEPGSIAWCDTSALVVDNNMKCSLLATHKVSDDANANARVRVSRRRDESYAVAVPSDVTYSSTPYSVLVDKKLVPVVHVKVAHETESSDGN